MGREAGPDPRPVARATFPGPAWLRVSKVTSPLQPPFFSAWRRAGAGKKRELGVPRCGLQVGGGALRDPGTSLFGQPGEARARRLYPGGVGEGTWGRGDLREHPTPRPCILARSQRPAGAALSASPVQPTKSAFNSLGRRKPTQVRARASPVPAGSWGGAQPGVSGGASHPPRLDPLLAGFRWPSRRPGYVGNLFLFYSH